VRTRQHRIGILNLGVQRNSVYATDRTTVFASAQTRAATVCTLAVLIGD